MGTVVATGLAPAAEAEDYIPLSQKGVANGVASLNAAGRLPYEQVPGPYIYAEQYGVVANDPNVNNSPKLQDAIYAAAAVCGTVVLPLGTISLWDTVRLPMNRVNILGGGYLTVITANLSKNGSLAQAGAFMFTLENAPAPAPGWADAGIFQRSVIANLAIFGPTGTNDTLNAFSWNRPADAAASGSVGGWHLERVAFRGFQYPEVFGAGAFLITHRSCSYTEPLKAANYYQGGANMGEAVQFEECVFQGGKNLSRRTAIYAPPGVSGTGIDAYYKHCSFDYINRYGVIAGGTFQFFGCHFETNSANPGFIVSSPNNGTRPTRLSFIGGQIFPHAGGQMQEPATDWTTFVKIDGTDPIGGGVLDSAYLVYASFLGVDLQNGVPGVPARIIDDTAKSNKLVTAFEGCYNATGNGASSLSVGGDSAVVNLDADFRSGAIATSTASAPAQSDLNKGWQIAASAVAAIAPSLTDQGHSPFSPKALTYKAPGGSGSKNTLVMWQVIDRPLAATVVQSNVAAFNDGNYVGNVSIRLTQLDASFAAIPGTSSTASVYMNGTNTSGNKADGGGVWKLDRLTKFLIVQLEATGVTAGTVGVATVQCVELSSLM